MLPDSHSDLKLIINLPSASLDMYLIWLTFNPLTVIKKNKQECKYLQRNCSSDLSVRLKMEVGIPSFTSHWV